MDNLKKFMFDNFIIDDEEDDEPETVDEVEAFNEPGEAEVEEMTDVAFEPIPEPAKTYTQEELEAAVLKATQEGYEKGYRCEQGEQEKELSAVMSNVDSKLLDLVVNSTELQNKMEKQFLNLNCAVLKKMMPNLLNEQCENIINQFLENNFPNFRHEAKLSFYFNPEIIGKVQEKIAQLAHIYDFEGKIALHKDASLGITDCRIEWENGGVEHVTDKLLEKVDNLLEENNAKN